MGGEITRKMVQPNEEKKKRLGAVCPAGKEGEEDVCARLQKKGGEPKYSDH